MNRKSKCKRSGLVWFVEKRHAVPRSFSVPWKKRWDDTAQVPLTGEELSTTDSTGERLEKMKILWLDDHVFFWLCIIQGADLLPCRTDMRAEGTRRSFGVNPLSLIRIRIHSLAVSKVKSYAIFQSPHLANVGGSFMMRCNGLWSGFSPSQALCNLLWNSDPREASLML